MPKLTPDNSAINSVPEQSLEAPNSSSTALYRLLTRYENDFHFFFAVAVIHRLLPYINSSVSPKNLNTILSNLLETLTSRPNLTLLEIQAYLIQHKIIDRTIANESARALSPLWAEKNQGYFSSAINEEIVAFITDTQRPYFNTENMHSKVSAPSAELAGHMPHLVSHWGGLPLVGFLCAFVAWGIRLNKAWINRNIAKSAEEHDHFLAESLDNEDAEKRNRTNPALDAGQNVQDTNRLSAAEIVTIGLVNISSHSVNALVNSQNAPNLAAPPIEITNIPLASGCATALLGLNILLNISQQIYAGYILKQSLSKEFYRILENDLANWLYDSSAPTECAMLLFKLRQLKKQRDTILMELEKNNNTLFNRTKLQTIELGMYRQLCLLSWHQEYNNSLGYFSGAHYEFWMHTALSCSLTVTSLASFGISLSKTLVFFGITTSAATAPFLFPLAILATAAVVITLSLLAYKFYRTYKRQKESEPINQKNLLLAEAALEKLHKKHSYNEKFLENKKQYEIFTQYNNLLITSKADRYIGNTMAFIGAASALLLVSIALGASLPWTAAAVPGILLLGGFMYFGIKYAVKRWQLAKTLSVAENNTRFVVDKPCTQPLTKLAHQPASTIQCNPPSVPSKHLKTSAPIMPGWHLFNNSSPGKSPVIATPDNLNRGTEPRSLTPCASLA